jgi:hypothetical protein
MLNQYKVGGKGDEVMQFFQIPYGETKADPPQGRRQRRQQQEAQARRRRFAGR